MGRELDRARALPYRRGLPRRATHVMIDRPSSATTPKEMSSSAVKAAEVETETALLGLEIDGFCVIESVIPAEAVGRVRDAVVASIEERQAAGHTNPAGNTTFINVNQDAAEYFADPRVLGVVERLWASSTHADRRNQLRHPRAVAAVGACKTGSDRQGWPA